MSLQCEGDIGATCDFEGCDTFDFLPWFCGDCGGRFCSTHRLAVDHRCEQASEESERDCSSLQPDGPVSAKPEAAAEAQKVSHPVRAEDAVCDICGNIGCLLHALHPEIVEKIAAERREALARRVWTGSGSNGGGGTSSSLGVAATTTASFHLPWRIGKFTAKQSKASTGVGAGSSRLAPRELALTGYTVQCIHLFIHSQEDEGEEMPISVDSIYGTEDNKNDAAAVPSSSSSALPPIATHNVSVVIKKATISHGVSIGYVADALRSLVGREIDSSFTPTVASASTCGRGEAEGKVGLAEKEKRVAVARNGDNVQMSSASATLYLPTCGSSISPGTKMGAASDCFGFRALTGLDGESAYLIDSLTGKGQQRKKNTDQNAVEKEEEKDGNVGTKSNGGELGGGVNESLLFCVINASNARSLPPASAAAPSSALELEALTAVCELFLSQPTLSGPTTAAQSFSMSSSCLTADIERPISFKFAFPQFPTTPTTIRDEKLPLIERQHQTQTGGKRPRDTAASSVAASGPTDSGNNENVASRGNEDATENVRSKSVGELGAGFTDSQRLAWQQVATLVRRSKGRIVVKGNVELASSLLSDGDRESDSEGGAAERNRKEENEVKQLQFPLNVSLASFFSKEFDFYKDSVKPIFGGGGGPSATDDNAKAQPANKTEEASWTFADLPVSFPKSNPINAKDPLTSKIPASSRAIIGVQVLPLRPLPKKSTTPPPAAAVSEPSTTTTTTVDASMSTLQLRKHVVLPSPKAKAFCMVVDTKWSVGRLLEKMRSEAGLPTPAPQSTAVVPSTVPSWSLVSIEVSAAVAPSSSSSSPTCPPPPFALKNVSSDLSALGEAVGIQNGSLILLIENDICHSSHSLVSRVHMPCSLLTFLDGAFASPTLTTTTGGTLSTRKLAPKSEAKLRKDCVVQ